MTDQDAMEVIDFLGGSMPKVLADQFKKLAKDNDRSVSGELRIAVRAHLEAAERAA